MNTEQKENQIKALMAAKDELERGLAVLKKENSTAVIHATKRIQCGVDLLRIEITCLQTGLRPHQAQAVELFADTDKAIVEIPRCAGKRKVA